MRIGLVITTTVCAVPLSALRADAQFCAGNPSFANHPYQVAINASITDAAYQSNVGGEFASGEIS
jgi:hypothetical protein